MNNIFKSALLLMGAVVMLTACSDDRDSNPVLQQPSTFVLNTPAYAEGIGERLQPISLSLRGWYLAVVRPDIPVPTKEAFALITPKHPEINCREVVRRPVEEWREALVNDFEQSVFALHPEIR